MKVGTIADDGRLALADYQDDHRNPYHFDRFHHECKIAAQSKVRLFCIAKIFGHNR